MQPPPPVYQLNAAQAEQQDDLEHHYPGLAVQETDLDRDDNDRGSRHSEYGRAEYPEARLQT
jgi:hypothetical protein